MEILIEPTNEEIQPNLVLKESGLIPPGDKESNVQAVSLDILQECVRLNFNNGFSKLVSFENLIDTLSEAIGKDKKSVNLESLSLPKGVFFMESNSSSMNLACFYEGGVRDVNFNGQVLKRIVPNVILYFKLFKGKAEGEWIHSSTTYFCTDSSLTDVPREFINKVSSSNRIFLLPFPNMYAEGAMCTGQNQLPKNFVKGDLRPLQWHFDMVWTSPFNYDLGIRALRENSKFADGHRGIEQWFVHLAEIAKTEDPQFPFKELRGWIAKVTPKTL